MTHTKPTKQHLQQLAAAGAQELGDASASELITWTADTFGTNFVIAANMQDAVLIDLVMKTLTPHRCAPHDVTALFLDTGYHFTETLGTKDAIASIYNLEVLEVTPPESVSDQDRHYGKDLYKTNPAQCCTLRKVQPLESSLAPYSAWITGIRRCESPTRANAPTISFDEKFGLVKINPIVTWTDQNMADYIQTNSVLVNPLVDEGYPSIGCLPCTNKPAPGADPRSGRWAGTAKTECGLHVS